MSLDWTDHGLGVSKAAESSAAFYAAKVRLQTERMQAGPRLCLDGHTLTVPSEWYNIEAAERMAGKHETSIRQVLAQPARDEEMSGMRGRVQAAEHVRAGI